MSIQMRTSVQTVHPISNESNNGRIYRSVDVQSLTSINIKFSPEGGKSPKQLEALYDKCADEGIEVDLITAQSTSIDRFNNQSYIVYDVIPKTSATPQTTNK